MGPQVFNAKPAYNIPMLKYPTIFKTKKGPHKFLVPMPATFKPATAYISDYLHALNLGILKNEKSLKKIQISFNSSFCNIFVRLQKYYCHLFTNL